MGQTTEKKSIPKSMILVGCGAAIVIDLASEALKFLSSAVWYEFKRFWDEHAWDYRRIYIAIPLADICTPYL
jgi:hypothetical protein